MLLTAFGKALQNKTGVGRIGSLKAEIKMDRKVVEILDLVELQKLKQEQMKLKTALHSRVIKIFPGQYPSDKEQSMGVSFSRKRKVCHGFQIENH